MTELEWQTEVYKSKDTTLAQELFDNGLIFLANQNALHHYGYAIGVTVDADGRVVEFNLHKTNDPDGIWFEESLIVEGRRKLHDRLS